MKVPFVDLGIQYESIRDEIDAAIRDVLESTAFSGGPFVTRFEEEFARFCGTKHAIGVGSGTDALLLSLLALGIGPRDEVITVPNTFIATAAAVSLSGAMPAFVDINEFTYNMDPNKLESYLRKRFSKDADARPRNTRVPRAVIPVHLFGQTADMDAICEIAKRYGLFVIEDACQAHGATYKGRKAGTMGDVGCFSFYPSKNLGAYGEAGAVVTNDDAIAEKVRMFRDHGQSRKYYHDYIGLNGRMDGLQAAVLSVKLKHLPSWIEARRSHATFYNLLLSKNEKIVTPREADYARHVYHVYAIRTGERDLLKKHLEQREIFCNIHYPVPIHMQRAYEHLGLKPGSFPISERCAKEFLSLPMYPELTSDQVEWVAKSIWEFFENRKA